MTMLETLLATVSIVLVTWALYQGLLRHQLRRNVLKRVRIQGVRSQDQPDTWWDRLSRWVGQTGYGRRLEEDLRHANVPLSSLQYIGILTAIGFLGHAVIMRMLPFGPILAASVVLLILQVGSAVYLRRRQKWMVDLFEALLPDTVRLMANSLRAGRTLQQTIAAVADEAPAPVSGVLLRASRQMELRSGVEEALRQLTQLMPSQELKWVELTLVVLHRSGGNLAEALDDIAQTLTERRKTRETVSTITRHPTRVALGLPVMGIGFILMLALMFQGFLSIYFSGFGLVLVGFFVVTQLIGYKLVKAVGKVDI